MKAFRDRGGRFRQRGLEGLRAGRREGVNGLPGLELRPLHSTPQAPQHILVGLSLEHRKVAGEKGQLLRQSVVQVARDSPSLIQHGRIRQCSPV